MKIIKNVRLYGTLTDIAVEGGKIVKIEKCDGDGVDFGGTNIPGFHMEGPFINKKFKGAQNEAYILPPSMELFNKCRNIKTVTVAPEVEGSEEFIKNCPAVVSIGHTDADFIIVDDSFNLIKAIARGES